MKTLQKLFVFIALLSMSPALHAQLRILPLGDSVTQGGGGVPSYRYPLYFDLIEAGYEVDFVGTRQTVHNGDTPSNPNRALYPDYDTTFDRDHDGYWGWRTDQILNIADTIAAETVPDIILFHLGSNDIGQRGTAGSNQALQNIPLILERFRAVNPNVTILLAQLLPFASNSFYGGNASVIPLFNAEVTDLVAEWDQDDSRVILVDHFTGYDAVGEMRDGLHPNLAGQQKMADRWLAAIDALSQPVSTREEEWASLADMPTPKAALGAEAVDGVVYAIGGWTPGKGRVDSVESYDLATATWTARAAMPTARDRPATAVVDGKIYAFGGFSNASNWLALTESEMYDPATDTWTVKEDLPTPRGGAGAIAVDGKIYVIGGWQQDAYAQGMDVYDPATDTWETLDTPFGNSNFGSASVNGKIYVVGGTAQSAATWEYDPPTDQWERKSPMIHPNHFLSASALDGKIYAFGGIEDAALRIYDPSEDTWSEGLDLPDPRGSIATTTLDGKLYMLGGLSGVLWGDTGTTFATMHVYTPASNGSILTDDSDGDGMPNDWEDAYGLDPADATDGTQDADGDSLTNVQEFERQTNPNEKDTDKDGLEDNVETKTDVWRSATDTGTSPTLADTDRDGLLDGVETNTGMFVDASNTGTNPIAKDSDGDGVNDATEVSEGSDPTDAGSVQSIQVKGGSFTVRHVDSTSVINNRGRTEALLSGDIEADEGDLTVERAFVNFVDDASGAFGDSIEPYPLWGLDGNSEGAPFDGLGDLNGGPGHDDFAIEVTGSFFIQSPGGLVTIGVNSDDGFVLWIDGEEIGQARGRPRQDSLMTVELASGQHELRMITWEGSGAAGVNMFIARSFGEVTSFSEGAFDLLNAFDITKLPLEGDDSDNDQMADTWETFYFGDLSHVGTEDGDADGLDDLGEYANKGNPTEKDTDGDGLEDGPEVHTHGTSPGRIDSDGDRLGDGEEVADGTDPTKIDTDGDTFKDNVEKALRTSATDPNSQPEAVIAVSDGTWNTPEIWSNNAAPSTNSDYAAIGSETSTLTSDGDFGGGSLSLIGPDLTLDLVGASAGNLILNQATLHATTSTSLGGELEMTGGALIQVDDNALQLDSRLTGAAMVTIQGDKDSASGLVELSGQGSDHASMITIVGTDVNGAAPGSLGTGTITLANGGVTFGYEYNNPTGLIKIQGEEFRIVLANDVTVADVVGIDESGGQIFSLLELMGGPGPHSSAAISVRLGTGDVSGDGTLTLLGNTGDTDIDGLQDAWETANFGNLESTPAGDPDGDGLNNLAEEAGNTDPNTANAPGDSGPIPTLTARLSPSNVVPVHGQGIRFDFPVGTTFNVEYSIDQEAWNEIATGVTGTYEDTDAGRNRAALGFYRGVAQP